MWNLIFRLRIMQRCKSESQVVNIYYTFVKDAQVMENSFEKVSLS